MAEDSDEQKKAVQEKAEKQKAQLNTIQNWSLVILAGVCVVFAILQVIFPERINEKTAMLLAVAGAVLVLPQITKFKGFGIEFEKEMQELNKEVKNVKQKMGKVEHQVGDVGEAVGGLEKAIGPGSKSATPTTTSNAQVAAVVPAKKIDPDDPNKGQFGETPEANGRKLSARIKPMAGPNSAGCKVYLRVESTDPSKPLTDKVQVHLHPTFGAWQSYPLEVINGVAQDEFTSFGAFTIGVLADGEATKLELDLMDVKGGTKRFYEQ